MTARLRIVLLPGLDGTGKLFAPLVSALAPDFDCTVVSYPDTLTDYAAHEARARAALPARGEFVVLGESFSGPIAVRLGADPPPNLRGIVVCASFLRAPRTLLAILRRGLRFLPAVRPPAFLSRYFLLGSNPDPALRAKFLDAISGVSPRTMLSRLEAIAGVDVRQEAGALRVPSLYVRASRDRVVPIAAGEEFLSLAPGARLAELEGPHLLLQANPGGAANALRSFLRSLPHA